MKKSKKILLGFVSIIAIIAIGATIIDPFAVLKAARQEEVAEQYNYSDSFLNNYDEVRNNLQKRIYFLEKDGVKVEYSEHAIDEDDNLYIDNLYIPAT